MQNDKRFVSSTREQCMRLQKSSTLVLQFENSNWLANWLCKQPFQSITRIVIEVIILQQLVAEDWLNGWLLYGAQTQHRHQHMQWFYIAFCGLIVAPCNRQANRRPALYFGTHTGVMAEINGASMLYSSNETTDTAHNVLRFNQVRRPRAKNTNRLRFLFTRCISTSLH
jgi:hypothetical protein